eukprot:TRINITY_DN643_c0_g1_i7.p1 TRINITY_DN643_c0_g1~~TRINITY_DN643_c0_g1_i7.p1  ORF type:complete len:305 (-),score=37.50 TRINITY_DN643_c0_g1_i7:269-1183(-)
MPNYGDPTYWDQRYSNQLNTLFDWLEEYSSLKPYIQQLASTDARILMLGCGNSGLSEEMYDDGFRNIDNVDISSVVIGQMKERNRERHGMNWEVMDVRDLQYENNTFDLAIDKSTIDALLCGDDSFVSVARMMKEVQRVLKPGGVYFVISYGAPENRVLHFRRPHLSFYLEAFSITSRRIEDLDDEEDAENIYYCYMAKKKADADEVSAKNWAMVFSLITYEILYSIKQQVEAKLIAEEEREKQLAKAYDLDKEIDEDDDDEDEDYLDGQKEDSLSEQEINRNLSIRKTESAKDTGQGIDVQEI